MIVNHLYRAGAGYWRRTARCDDAAAAALGRSGHPPAGTSAATPGKGSCTDPERVYADPDPAFYTDADPDTNFFLGIKFTHFANLFLVLHFL